MRRADIIGKQRGASRRFQPGFKGRLNFRRPVEPLHDPLAVPYFFLIIHPKHLPCRSTDRRTG
jgi:hypothetical protein